MLLACRSNWAFFLKWVPHYHFRYDEWCVRGANIVDEQTHATHSSRLCEAARFLQAKYPDVSSFFDTPGVQKIWDTYEEHAFLDNSTLVPCSCQNQKVQMFKVMRSWFGDTETIRDAYRDAAWFNGNFDSSVQQCGAEVRGPKVDWSQYTVIEWIRQDTLAECVDMFYSEDSAVEYVSASNADVGNIAGMWQESWGNRGVNVTDITNCMQEIKREREAVNSVRSCRVFHSHFWPSS